MLSRIRSLGVAIGLASALASGCGSSPGSTTAGTGAGGTGGGTQEKLEPFTATSTGFSAVTAFTVIAISDVAGNAGCALATSTEAAPPGDGHDIVISIGMPAGASDCAAGTYAIGPGCNPDGFDGSQANCAEYRRYAAGSIVGHATALSGAVTLSDDGVGNKCTFDVELGFGTGGTYSEKFTVVYTGPAPWCTPG
jgi:hypothetical protein